MTNKKVTQPKFNVTCPHCGKTIKNVKIGAHSYIEVRCPECNSPVWAKSTNIGVKVNLAPTSEP